MWWYDDFVLAESQFDAQFMEADNSNEQTKLLFAERAMQCVDNTKKRATWAANLLANRGKSDRQQTEEEQKGEYDEPQEEGQKTPRGWDAGATAGNGAGSAVHTGRGPGGRPGARGRVRERSNDNEADAARGDRGSRSPRRAASASI